MKAPFKHFVRLAAVSPLALATPLMAQTAASPAAAELPVQSPPAQSPADNAIVVTGTSVGRTQLKTPGVATSFNSDRLAVLSANSQADILATIPSLKAEGGGGEVAANVYVSGLPSGGQYQFTPIQFNGSQTIASMGLNSSAIDIYKRPDMGVERLEFVRGGVSNLFGSGGIGGIINYIDKKGGDEDHGKFSLEGSGHSRIKAEMALSGPIGNGYHYALSGWYRYDEGPLYSGFTSKGYQLRGNISHEFEGGQFTIYAQAINDRTPFYGDIPLNGQTYRPATGNNGSEVLTTETAALANVAFQTPNGTFHTSVGDGVYVSGYSFGTDFKKDFGGGWAVNGKANIANYTHSFALFNGGDNVTNLPTTQTAFLQSYASQFGSTSATFNPANYTASFSFANNGAAVPSNYLLWGDRVTDRSRNISTAEGELNLTKELQAGTVKHHVTLGSYFGQTSAHDFDVTYSYIGDFDNNPQLVNVSVTNITTGATTILASNGLTGTGTGYTNNYADSKRYAVYLADQMEAGKWIFDIGGRWEKLDGYVTHETSAKIPGGVLATGLPANTQLSAALSNITWGTGTFLPGKVDPSSWALAANVLYKMTDQVSLFLNASRGYFMPELRSVVIDTHDDVQSFEPEVIKQVMGGVKFRTPRISGSASAFYVTLSNLRNVQLINGAPPGSAPTEVVNLVSTRTYGAEGNVTATIVPHLTFEGNATWQHDVFTQYTPVAGCASCVGNRETRQPDFVSNFGLYFRQSIFDASLFDTYTGRTFTSDLNNIRLGGYNILRFDIGAKIPVSGNQTLRLGLDIYNLLNNQGATEGNPRQGALQNAGQAYFVGRDILPRRIMGKLSYSF